MSEIFLIGVLVSMVKIMSLAEVSFGTSFFAYVGFVIFYVSALTRLNRARLWSQVSPAIRLQSSAGAERAIDDNIKSLPCLPPVER